MYMQDRIMNFLDNFINNKTILIFIIFLMLYSMDFNQTQAPAWIAPYLSAAANFDFSSLAMYIDQTQIEQFSKLTRPEQFDFNFVSSSNIERYDHLAIGFYFISILATKIFFFIGDLEAIVLLQQIVHVSLSFLIMTRLEKSRDKVIFFIFYMINPIVLYFVNFPFYYFWQMVMSVIFVYYYMSNKKIGNYIFILTLAIYFLYIIRPSILFLIFFFYLFYMYKESWKKGVIAIGIFLSLITGLQSSYGGGPWHTMYVGIGAYQNPYGIKLSDESGYEYFNKITSKTFGSKDVTNEELKNEYYNTIKNKYLEILKKEPVMIVQNAIFNTIGAYALGYKTGSLLLIYINIFLGLMMVILLLYTKQYILFLAIGAGSISFTPYYPPISAYMYGNYILLVIGFIGAINFININRLNLNKKKEY